MAGAVSPRISVDGKFFRLGQKKFYVKGVAYGPFPPNTADQPFAAPEQTAEDFAQIRQLGANLIRIYHPPAKWFLDLATYHDLKVFVDIPWNQHLCFLDSDQARSQARDAVRRAVYSSLKHPAIFAFSVANEVPPDVVRWSGTEAIADFIDDLILDAKSLDPDALFTYTNFPPTEFLRPQCVDFVCFNVYLHQQPAFKNYLARLQMSAESKPLLLGEFGMDSLREGESAQCRFLEWQIEAAFRGGLAGEVVFAFTDEWFKDGRLVPDWQMGLTTANRRPKPSFNVVQSLYALAPDFSLPRYPKSSVIVAAYNAGRTLKACLDSLQRLNYPDYEVIVVDDGSADSTAQIASAYPSVRLIRHTQNLGLSTARNTGIAAAKGEIVAFTDADCRADEDWLRYLAGDLLDNDFAGVGGPNLLPPEDSPVAAAIMASPGGPAHVMLTDRQAEHIPGCNMAFFKWALDEVGGFDPVFRIAGDDVDLCWRLQQAGHSIGFSPAAFVWHYRRSTIGQYLNQQHGYGEAETMLARKHPECFNSVGASLWRGRIYTSSKFGILIRPSMIYRGLFGGGGFQTLYASQPASTLMLCTSLEYHVTIVLPLWVLSVIFPHLLPLAITSLVLPIAICAVAGAQATLPPAKARWWSRPLVASLYFLQPIVRGLARYSSRLLTHPIPLAAQHTLDSLKLRDSHHSLNELQYWSENRINRLEFVAETLRQLDRQGWPNKSDVGWSEYDVEVQGSRWCNLQLITVVEDHPGNKQLLRCRLRGRWSLQAKVTFWGLSAVELLLLGFVPDAIRWLWLLVLTLPLLAWFFRREKRDLQSMITILLDEIAKQHKLAKIVPQETASEQIKPTDTTQEHRNSFEIPASNVQAPEKLQ